MALRILEQSMTAPNENGRWDDDFLRAERTRLGLGRRSDRMTAAVVSALDRLTSRPAEAPIIFGSMFGVQSRITALQYDLLDYPDDQIGPVSFSCSVHNAAPGAAAILFQTKVPVFSLAGVERFPQRFFALADAILATGDTDHVLAVLTEERSCMTDHAMRMLKLEPTEFAAAFVLGRAGAGNALEIPPDADYFSWLMRLFPSSQSKFPPQAKP